MAVNKYICPVCNQGFEQQQELCPNCGWLRIVYPIDIPRTLQSQEEQRFQIAREIYNERKQLKEQLSAGGGSAVDSKLKQELEAAKQQITRLTNELSRANEEAKKAQEAVEAKNTGASQIGELRDAQKDINRLTQQIKVKDSQIEQLNDKIAELKQQIQSANSNTVPMNVKGVIFMKNKETFEEAVMMIYDGYNTYGSAPSNGLHHKIKLDPITFGFEKKHFSVDTTAHNGKIVLQDLSNGTLKCGGTQVPKNGKYLNNTIAIINDIIEMKFIKL